MSNVIIWKLDVLEVYKRWYEFLNWKDEIKVTEISHWDDSQYSDIIYKAYRVDDETDLTYILLKWPVICKGNYHKWIEEKRKIDSTVYTAEDIHWINKDD